jgi:hypothetical protein
LEGEFRVQVITHSEKVEDSSRKSRRKRKRDAEGERMRQTHIGKPHCQIKRTIFQL